MAGTLEKSFAIGRQALWTEATRMPLMVRLPGMSRRQDCERVVNMIDFIQRLLNCANCPQSLFLMAEASLLS